jgi:aryl-alcohol dehydrogenase-like predicted oxidoreductase
MQNAKVRLGLGCSRLGSVLSTGADSAETLLNAAYDMGVRVFDTADIYGQGDSERALGRFIAGRPDALIVTKIGKRYPLKMRLMMPLKAPLQRLVRASSSVTQAVRKGRASLLPTCFEPDYLRGAAERGLKRLGVEQFQILMLHSPTAAEVADGAALEVLRGLKREGKLAAISISCEDVATAEAALAAGDVEAIQVPLSAGDAAFLPVIAKAAAAGVTVMAREVLSGLERRDPDSVRGALRRAAETPGVGVVLLGTTRAAHLKDAIEVF